MFGGYGIYLRGYPIPSDTGIQLLVFIKKYICPNVSIEPHLQPLSGERLRLKSANPDDGTAYIFMHKVSGEIGIRVHSLILGSSRNMKRKEKALRAKNPGHWKLASITYKQISSAN